jgi:hypothetical protein
MKILLSSLVVFIIVVVAMTEMMIGLHKPAAVEEIAYEVFDILPESGVSWAYAEMDFYPAAPGNGGFDRGISQGTMPVYAWWFYDQFTTTEHTGINQWWAKADVISQASGRRTIGWDNGGLAGQWVDLWNDWELILTDQHWNGVPEDMIVDVSIAPDTGGGAPDTSQAVTERLRWFAYRGRYDYLVSDEFGRSGDLDNDTPDIDRRNAFEGGNTGQEWHDMYYLESDYDHGGFSMAITGRIESYVGSVFTDALYTIDSTRTDVQIAADFKFYYSISESCGGGIVARAIDSANFWLLAVKNPDAANPVLGLYKVTAGTHTLEASLTLAGLGPLASNAYYSMRLTIEGNTFTGEFEMTEASVRTTGPLKFSHTDATYNTSTDHGVWAENRGIEVRRWRVYEWPVGFNPIVMSTSPVTSTRTDNGTVYTNVYFYEGSNDPNSYNVSAGFWINDSTLGFFDTIDMRLVSLNTETFVLKVEAVSGDTGRIVIREYGTTLTGFNTWMDYFRCDISLEAEIGESLSAVVDVTIGVDDGTGNPMASPAPVTKRITLVAVSTGT